jgi:3-hydroxyacyl-CoA dehydrogenase/enoyl-CoA hydratase/3-hydroxybutyryl-CoA epimerase/3-hydroxyacyl-CoA dehydrogenase/enoyl-CoA hydratase/3-hydroxybutyryl-CoA epimerase/enoyl-CoA isomerase
MPRASETREISVMPAAPAHPATLAIEHGDDGFLTLAFAVPGHRQNVLTPGVLADLAAVLDDLEHRPPRRRPRGLLLVSGRPGSFFAGADIARLDEVRGLSEPEIARLCDAGRALFARLSRLPWPSVAVIDGVCLGGGLELALACDLRVASDADHTLLGLPEVKLGLLPGWGGTVRLSRLIGPGPAVEFAAAGDGVSGPAAARMGLVDACVPVEQAVETARRLVAAHGQSGFVAARRRRQASAVAVDPLEREFLEATSSAVILGRTGGHYPAPPAILRTILAGAAVDADAAGAIESAAFAKLARSPVAGQLLRVFRSGERNRRDPGIGTGEAAAEGGDAVAPFAAPAVIGAGIMGAGIAAAHLRTGSAATLIDVSADALAAAVPGLLDEAAWDRATKRADPARAVALAGRLRTATQLAAVAGADLVIESVTERTDVKQQVLADIERLVGPAAIIATNTSTNPIARLAAGLADPARFCGMHFFNPVRRMTLVEVVRGPATSDATVAAVVAHAKRLGKCPVVVRDSPGFLVNRILMPYLHEAVEMARAGVECRRIDRVSRGFGMPMGPIELYDMIGLDTAFYAGLVLSAAYGDRIEASPVIPALVKSGRLGRKSGCGFYRYAAAASKPRMLGPDAGAAELIRRYALPARETSDRAIADRLLLPMLLEAIRALDEGLVRDGRDIDLAVIHALGFPAFRGGLLAWADTLGPGEIVRRLEPLADLGPRMVPTERLLEMARDGLRFTA